MLPATPGLIVWRGFTFLERSRLMTNLRLIAEAEAFLYNQGTYYHAYNKLGAHIMEVDGQDRKSTRLNSSHIH